MSGWDDFLKEINKEKEEQPAAATTQNSSSWDSFLNEIGAQPSTPVVQEPVKTPAEDPRDAGRRQQREVAELLSAAAPAVAEKEDPRDAGRRQQREVADKLLDNVLAQKQADKATAEKDSRKAFWNFLNTMISNAGAGSAGVVAAPMDSGGALDSLQEAKATAQKARAVTDWEGRDELEKEYNQLRLRALFDPISVDGERMKEIKEKLDAGDRAAGNLQQTYGAMDTADKMLAGTAKNIGSSALNAATTFLDAGAKAHSQSYSTNEYMRDLLSGADMEKTRQEKAEAYDKSRELWDKLYSAADNWSESSAKDIQAIKNGTGALGGAATDVAENVLQMGFDAGVAGLTGGSALVPMFFRVFGSSAQEARQNGANLDQQLAYGLAKGAIETATEKMFDGVAKIYGAGAADDITEELVRHLAETDTGRTFLRLFINAAGEGGEEVVSDMFSPLAERIYNKDAMKDGYWNSLNAEEVLYDFLIGMTVGALGSGGSIATGQNAQANAELNMRDAGIGSVENQTAAAMDVLTGRMTPEQQQARQQRALDRLGYTVKEADEEATSGSIAQNNISAPPAQENAPVAAPASAEVATEETPAAPVETTATEATEPSAQAGEQTGNQVERGFSKNIRTDENMEQEIRDDFTNDPDYYTQLSNKETLGKAQKVFAEGLDTARNTVEEALANAKAGKKLAPDIVPLARMVANELTRNGEKASARRILSDLAVELTQAGQLGQAAKILRSTDAQTALKTVQKALDKINAEIKKKRGNRAKWKAELTESEKSMLENIDMGDEAAFQEAYKQIADRIGKEMPATLWEKVTELRRINMLLKPRTQIRNIVSNAPMVLLRKGAETMSGAIQDEMVKLGVMEKAQQTRTLKVSKDIRNKAKEYVKANKDSILSEGNKWDMNTMLRESRTYFKGGALERAISKLSGKEQQSLLEQARRFTYKLLEKGDAPFVMSAYTDSLAQYMASQGLTDFDNIPQAALDFASANAMEATFKNASAVASFINQIKRNGGALGKALDVVFPFTTTPANIFNLMIKYSPAGFADTISKAVKKANAPDIIDSASKATVGSAVFGLGLLLRSLGAITGKPDDDEDKRALDKATGKSPYSIAGRWSYDWAQPVGSLLVLGAETWDAMQGQEGVADAVMNAIYSAGDSALNMSLFQNITSMLKGYGSNTEKILNAIVEGGGTQLVPGLAGDIAALIDDTVRSSYTGGNVLQTTLAKMGMNLPGLSKKLPASVNVKGEENKRGNLAFRAFEKLVDPGTYNRNEPDERDRAIYDLYEETNDKTILPHVAPKKFDYGGETYRMTGDEYERFQKTEGQTYYEMLDALLESDEWADLSTEAKVKLLQDAASYSLDEAKRELVESRGGEYESNDWEKLSAYADGDKKTAAQFLAIKDQAKTAIKNEDGDILDKLLGKDGAYRELSEDAQEMLNIDHLKKIVAMNDNGLDAAGALTVVNTISDLEPAEGHKSVTQQQQVDAIIDTDLTDEEKVAAIKAYTSDSYAEKMQAALDEKISLDKWSEVRNKYSEINDTEGLSAMQKATRFAAALDNDESLTEKQRKVLREQLTYSSMSTAEAKRYDTLTDAGMDSDTAVKVADSLLGVTKQNDIVDKILSGGYSEADTWKALETYTSESWYDKAAEAYRRGIDLDDYVSSYREADADSKNGLSQAELFQYFKDNPDNETFVKVMWLIGGYKTDWETYKRKHK